MQYYTRMTNCIPRDRYPSAELVETESGTQEKSLRFLYGTTIGRAILKPLVSPIVSKTCGRFLDSGLSKKLIPFFIKKCNLDMTFVNREVGEFKSYNDFFTRELVANARPVDHTNDHLISPCDSKLLVYEIHDDLCVQIKNTIYTMHELLRDPRLAEKYKGGSMFIFRLSVDDYHRYCYIDSGKKTHNRRIPGVFHTVHPVAGDLYPIYKQNTREYCMMRTDHFGDVIMMEVGALNVGRIVNYKQKGRFSRGEEKGRFEFGGSTIVLFFEKDRVVPDPDIMLHSSLEIETKVSMGEKIGVGGVGNV